MQKVSKYGFFSGPEPPLIVLNTGKYGPEKTLYLYTFHFSRTQYLYVRKMVLKWCGGGRGLRKMTGVEGMQIIL